MSKISRLFRLTAYPTPVGVLLLGILNGGIFLVLVVGLYVVVGLLQDLEHQRSKIYPLMLLLAVDAPLLRALDKWIPREFGKRVAGQVQLVSLLTFVIGLILILKV